MTIVTQVSEGKVCLVTVDPKAPNRQKMYWWRHGRNVK